MSDKATVILFKESGKYYTQEEWTIPDGAIGPFDMERSPDFRRIGHGAVFIVSQEPWGYPCLFNKGELTLPELERLKYDH